jgi:2Fe-2S ferredoxin
MAEIVYILQDGSERRVVLADGLSVMLGAIENNIKGIDAECGGCCACATCHVYVDERFLDRLPPPDIAETELLTGVAAEQLPNSRLSCQITVSAALDGLIVRMPDRQT